MASDGAAKEVLAFAKNRLNKFYNPKLYKPPADAELSKEDQIYSNMGNPNELVTTAAPGGIAGTGITAFAQMSMHEQNKAAPGPPPATWGAYSSKSGENTGVITMIDLLIKDLEKEMTEVETDEKNSQADYEQLMIDSAAKRTTDSKVLTEKGSTKADTEASLQGHEQHRTDGPNSPPNCVCRPDQQSKKTALDPKLTVAQVSFKRNKYDDIKSSGISRL